MSSRPSPAAAAGPIVFLSTSLGLANRLRALAAYQAAARCRARPFLLCWVPDPACETAFSDLFEPSCDLIPLHELDARRQREPMDIFKDGDWGDDIWAKTCADTVSWPVFLEAYRTALRTLQPKAALVRRVEAFAAAHGLAARLGVHIRHTDNLAEYDRWIVRSAHKFDRRCVSQLDGFTRELDRQADTGIFLATDNDTVAARLQQRYGSRLTLLPKAFAPLSDHRRARPTPVEIALEELLLLGRCAHVLGTYYSSFSRMAAVLGGRSYSEIQGGACVADPPIPSASRLLHNALFC